MYFETGQGSSLSADAHHGVDQQTCEARAYAVARRYSRCWSIPWWASSDRSISTTASRSLAPASKTTSAASCSGCRWAATSATPTHAEADHDDMDTLLTLLGVAGVNYIMGVPGADDVMLNYQSTSFHDIALSARGAGRCVLHPSSRRGSNRAYADLSGARTSGRVKDALDRAGCAPIRARASGFRRAGNSLATRSCWISTGAVPRRGTRCGSCRARASSRFGRNWRMRPADFVPSGAPPATGRNICAVRISDASSSPLTHLCCGDGDASGRSFSWSRTDYRRWLRSSRGAGAPPNDSGIGFRRLENRPRDRRGTRARGRGGRDRFHARRPRRRRLS